MAYPQWVAPQPMDLFGGFGNAFQLGAAAGGEQAARAAGTSLNDFLYGGTAAAPAQQRGQMSLASLAHPYQSSNGALQGSFDAVAGATVPDLEAAINQTPSWVRYANQGATRSQPISPRLAAATRFLPELGVTMEVFSGGQPEAGQGPRVGSTRHDHGNAADVFFYQGDRRLDWANPQDRPIFEEIVRRGREAGITGFGAGQGYMQPGSMHIGFGDEAVWGAGGSGANAPDWLRSAYNSGTSQPGQPIEIGSPAADAAASIAQGGNVAPQRPSGGFIPMTPPAAIQQPQATLPPREVMEALFRSAETRPMAIQMAQAAMSGTPLPQYQTFMREDGSVWQMDTTTGAMEVLQEGAGAADPTSAMQNYEYLIRQGVEPDQALERAFGGGQTINVGGENTYDSRLAGGYADRFLSLQGEAQSAQSALNSLDVMEQAMSQPGFYSGFGADQVQQLRSLGRSLGLTNAEGIDSMETFNAQAKSAALDAMGGSLGTGFSNADRDFVLDQVPQLSNTPEGNAALIRVQRAINQRKIQIAELARQYAELNGGRIDAGLDRYLAQWAEQNPLFPEGTVFPDAARRPQSTSPAPTGNQPYVDGTVIENDVGQRMIMRNGQWEFI